MYIFINQIINHAYKNLVYIHQVKMFLLSA